MKRFSYIFLICIYNLSGLHHVTCSVNAADFCNGSSSAKNPAANQLNIKLPKYINVLNLLNSDETTFVYLNEHLKKFEHIEILQAVNQCTHPYPSILKPSNKAPPIA